MPEKGLDCLRQDIHHFYRKQDRCELGRSSFKHLFGRFVMHKKLGITKAAERFIRRHIRRHIKVLHMKRSQAIAVALHEARDKGFKIPPKKKRRLL